MRILFVFLSFILHILFFLFFFEKKQKNLDKKDFVIIFNNHQKIPKAANLRGKKGYAKTPKSKFQDDSSLEKILRRPIIQFEHSQSSIVSDGFDENGSLGGLKYFQETLELPRPQENIWRQIRAHIHFHPDFFTQRLQGKVQAQILVGRGGRLESLVSIDGNKELVEWVKTALYNSLQQDYLNIPMSKKLLLDLNFQFKIVSSPPPVQDYHFERLKLSFDILGYEMPGQLFSNRGKFLLYAKKNSQSSDWNFSKKTQPYEQACFHQKNGIGCEKLLDMYAQAGMHEPANEVKKFLKQIKNSSN